MEPIVPDTVPVPAVRDWFPGRLTLKMGLMVCS